MISQVIWNVVRFFALVLIQALIINNVEISRWVNPMLYMLFLMMLPLRLPRWAELLLGFVTGLFMDSFTHTPGLHTSACVALAYARPTFIGWVAPREGAELVQQPDMRSMGFSRFLTYAGLAVAFHHIWFFGLEAMTMSNIWYTLLKVLLSAITTFMLVVLSQFLFLKPARAR
jgi:rod shape-determining protein MreD